jgi:predicted nucleic acid-binding protein
METGWVLQRSYGFARADIRSVLAGLAELTEVSLEPETRLGTVLTLMDAGLDLGDAFIAAAVPSELSFATFDRRLRRRAEQLGIAVEEP